MAGKDFSVWHIDKCIYRRGMRLLINLVHHTYETLVLLNPPIVFTPGPVQLCDEALEMGLLTNGQIVNAALGDSTDC